MPSPKKVEGYLTSTEFCAIENFEEIRLSDLKLMCKRFLATKDSCIYFEGYSSNKCKYTLCLFLKRAQKRMKIDLGLI